MMKNFCLPVLLIILIMTAGCEDSATRDKNIAQKEKDSEIQAPESNVSKTSVVIEYSDSTIYVSKQPMGVKISRKGNHVVVHSRVKNMTYILKGQTRDGSFKLYSDHKFILNLNGLSLANSRGAAINIRSKRHGFILLSGENVLNDGREYEEVPAGEIAPKACFYSEGNLIFCGDGRMILKGNYKHAIAAKGYIRVSQDCEIQITSAVKDGMTAGTNMLIDGGNIDITVSDDAVKCAGDLIVSGGNTVLKAKGGEGSEGMEGNTVTINDGILKIMSYDDAINAAKSIVFNGGSVYAYSANNDAIDSNGSITINGGLVVGIGTQVPECGMDCDMYPILINGGTLLAIGGANSFPNSRTSEQPTISYGAVLTEGDYINFRNSKGENVLIYKIPRTYFQANILYSSPRLKEDSVYVLYTGGRVSGGTEAYGMSVNAQYIGGKKEANFTLKGLVTSVGLISKVGPQGMPNGGFPEGGPQPGQMPEGGFPEGGPQGMPNGGFMQGGPQPGQMGFPQGGPQGMGPGRSAGFPEDFPPATPSVLL